jgi:hypothetical protein
MRPCLFALSLSALLLACGTLSSAEPTEATATPTFEPTPLSPTESPAPAVPPEATSIPGWLTYHNSRIGYAFDYPPEAVLTTSGVTGYPSEELPPGIETGQYVATLEATYTEALCAGIELPSASFVLWAPEEEGGRYGGPCGVTGIGVYDVRTGHSPITIDGQVLTLKTMRLFEVGTDTLVDEFASVRLSDGTLLSIISHWQEHGLTYEDYLADREAILRVMSSYRNDPQAAAQNQ